MSRVVFILILPFLLAAVGRTWWVYYVYEPKSEASRYSRDFSAIEIYTCKNNKYFTLEQCQEIRRNKGFFSAVRDLNDDGRKELWSVGVAKFKSDRSGNNPYANVVVVSNPETNEIQQVLTFEKKEPGFAVFLGKENELSLFFCMECGSYVDIEWINNRWDVPVPYCFD